MKARKIVFVLFVLPLLFALPGAKLKAAVGWEKHFDVYWTTDDPCKVGPTIPDELVGQWDQDCDGNMTGWGEAPVYGCPRKIIVTYGAYCGNP